MHRRRFVPSGACGAVLCALALVLVLGCASNPTRRCVRREDCLDADACYRGFCIAPSPSDGGVRGDVGASCPSGRTSCEGRCVDLLRDRDHCGACDVACRGGGAGACVLGRCADD